MGNGNAKCEDCGHYMYDELLGEYVCQANLDEDELERFALKRTSECVNYRKKSPEPFRETDDIDAE